MEILIYLIFSIARANQPAPLPFPIFLKQGFSSILEFEEAPTQIVLGDSNSFQVEKLGKSIVIKPAVNYATTNMFVYFATKTPRLFLLSASEEAEPTYFKKFESFMQKPQSVTATAPPLVGRRVNRGVRIKMAKFEGKKDYFTIDVQISTNSEGKVLPKWDAIRLKYKKELIEPLKIWSERKEIQRDSTVDARFIFAKPNIPRNLNGVTLIIPAKDKSQPFSVELGGHQ